jgi:soluble lytic murein transglycosylase
MRLTIKFNIFLVIIGILLSPFYAFSNINEIAKEYIKGNISKAMDESDRKKYKNIHLFLESQKLLSGKDANFEKIVKFLHKNPYWPEKQELIRAAERNLNSSTHKKIILEWFSNNKPLTSKGYYYFYLASQKKSHEDKRYSIIVKNAWIYGSMTSDEEKTFLKHNRNILTEHDHAMKVAEFYWSKNFKPAEKYMPLLTKEHKQIFKATKLIIERNPNAEKEFRKVKDGSRYFSVLLYHYLESHKKDEPNSELVFLLKKSPEDVAHRSQWWKIRHYYSRELIERKKNIDAYKIVSGHVTDNISDMAEAEWLSGWLSYRFLKKPNLAIPHFENLFYISKSSISRSRASYWLGRCFESVSNKEEANRWYSIASQYGFTFYGQLAQYELKQKNLNLGDKFTITKKDIDLASRNICGDIALFLSYTNNIEKLKTYSKEAFYCSKTKGESAYILSKLRKNLSTSQTTEVAKIAQQAGILVLDASFPEPYKFPRGRGNKILSYSIMRQESVFEKKAVSTANAMGLMQLLPNYAEKIARANKMKFFKRKLLTDPEYNIKLGSILLEDLLKEYKSYILVSCSYNAGIVVEKWIDRMGDPRKMNLYDSIDWIESIPYYETRNYVQRILENMQVYRTIFTKDKKLRIHQDIKKG